MPFANLPIIFFLFKITKINIAMSGKMMPFNACAISKTSNGSNPSEEVMIPMEMTIANTSLYFYFYAAFPTETTTDCCCGAIGEAIAEDRPAENNPTLMNIGAKSPNTGLRGSDNSTKLVTSLPWMSVPAVISMAADISPPNPIATIVSILTILKSLMPLNRS